MAIQLHCFYCRFASKHTLSSRIFAAINECTPTVASKLSAKTVVKPSPQ